MPWINYTFTKDDYSTLEGGKVNYGPINSLILKSSVTDSENVSTEDQQSITQYGEHQFTITEDYFLYNATKRQAALSAIWAKVHNLQYVDCKLTTQLGKPFLHIGDKIRVYTSENDYFDTYILKHKFTYDGAFMSEIESPVLTQQEVKTKQDISLGEKLTNTQIIVNKGEKRIDQIVEAVGDNGEVTSASIVTAINNDTSQIKLEADKIDINGVVSANNNFKIKNDGSVEINNGSIELTDTTSSGGTSKIKITGSYNGDISNMELYSNAMLMNTQYNGYVIVRNIGDEGIFLMKVADDLSYRTENFLLHNQIIMSSNNTTTFEVDGTTGNTTIGGIATISNGTANQKATIVSERTDTGNSIEFGVGAGGVNRGIFDGTLNRWLFYTDGTNVYLDGTKTTEITKATAISQSNFITLNNGFTMKHFNVNKLGNHIFGNMVIQSTNNIGTSGVIPANIKSGYRINTGQYSFCGLATSDWSVDTMGYIYLGAGGDFSVVNVGNASNIKYIVIELNYMTA